ncbi:MAG: sporulation protein YqfD [Clostridia bacterium]
MSVLINGWMEGKFTGIRYVHAKGDVEAKVWHTKHKKILYNTTETRGNRKIQTQIYAMKINIENKFS